MTTNPAEKLEALFNDIAATRMAGLPICNTALRVEAVGFREWQGHWVGVLVTPWTISLALMPGDEPLRVLGAEEKMAWEFPSGKYMFMGLNEPALASCQICSLISPVIDFGRHEDAVDAAHQVMAALFVADDSAATRKKVIEAARLNGESVLKIPLSRRDFLRGGLLGK